MSSASSSPANLAAVPSAATAVVPLPRRHRSRQVGFNSRTQVYLVPSLGEYTDEELEACFTTEQDTKRNQRDIVTSTTGARTHGINAEGICIRGLEYLVNPSDVQDRQAAKERHYDAILDEQDRQWDAGVFPTDCDAIAKASLCTSQDSRDRAEMMGAKDAVIARRINETTASTASNSQGRINKRRSSVQSVASHRRSSSFSECSLSEEADKLNDSQAVAAANQQQVATQV